ncbi:hypothetical protein J6590_032715 [Homalodisca vitripennis]|nr:hypothetical protein J6590_032715 [Homalodisca vitripennis]
MSNPKCARLTKRDILDEFDNPLSSDEEDCVAVDSDDGEVDHVEEEIHLPHEEDAEMAPTSPSSPQDMSECDNEDNTPLGNVFYSKDKQKRVMKWNKCPLDPSNIRTRASNIVLRSPGPRGEFWEYKNLDVNLSHKISEWAVAIYVAEHVKNLHGNAVTNVATRFALTTLRLFVIPVATVNEEFYVIVYNK